MGEERFDKPIFILPDRIRLEVDFRKGSALYEESFDLPEEVLAYLLPVAVDLVKGVSLGGGVEVEAVGNTVRARVKNASRKEIALRIINEFLSHLGGGDTEALVRVIRSTLRVRSNLLIVEAADTETIRRYLEHQRRRLDKMIEALKAKERAGRR